MKLQDEKMAFTLENILKDAVKHALMSNRVRGIPNIYTKGNSLVCEFKNKIIRYKGQEPIEKWIEESCAVIKDVTPNRNKRQPQQAVAKKRKKRFRQSSSVHAHAAK